MNDGDILKGGQTNIFGYGHENANATCLVWEHGGMGVDLK